MHAYAWTDASVKNVHSMEPCIHALALVNNLYLQVDRRYRRYCEQMRALAGGFEAVAGERAAAAYTALASRTISRHFRSLRDGVVAQLNSTSRGWP